MKSQTWMLVGASLLLGASAAVASETTTPAPAALAAPASDPKLVSSAPVEPLVVTQDEESLEKAVAKYLKTSYNLAADLKMYNNDPGDLYVQYTLNPKDTPEIKVSVDTQSTGKDKDGKVDERLVTVKAYFIVPDACKTPELRAKLLEFNNSWMNGKWTPGKVTIDKDGDIALQSCVNIPGKQYTLHPEFVWDMVIRMNNSWGQYFVELKKVLPVGVEAPAEEEQKGE